MNLLKKCFLGLALCISGTGILSAQPGTLKGSVTDAASGAPLTGAHIVLDGFKTGGISDYKGAYRITGMPAGSYTATISYIGYETMTVDVVILAGQETVFDQGLRPKPYLAEQAVITASRVQVSRNLTPFTVSVVDRQMLESSGESNLLPVVARTVPGVFVTERGVTGFGVADGAAGGISIRGVGGNPNTQVLVLVDGHPQFMGLFGHPLPDTYIASDAEKVEVIRGPASVIYGSNAMGGVINVITRQTAEDGVTLNANAGYGMFNTFKVNGNAGFRKNKFQAFLSYNHDRTEGHRDHSDFNIHNGYAKLSYDINAHFRVWGDFSLAHYSSTNPGPEGSTDTTFQVPSHWQEIWRSFASVALENTYEKSSGAAKFYFNYGEHQIWDGFLSYDQNFGLNLYQALKFFRGNTVTVGYDLASYGGSARNILPEVPVRFADTSIMETGVYGFIQQQWRTRLTLTAGLRYQYHELYKSALVPHFGASYAVSDNTALRANVSKGFRSPTIRELFLFKPANPGLEPENMWNYEAGIIRKLIEQKLTLDLTGFYSKGSNLIETTGVFPDVLNQNTGDFEHLGIEFQGRYMVLKALDVMANYTWLHTDKPMTGAPEHMLYLEGNYRPGSFAFRLSAQFIGNLTTLTNPVTVESYLNLMARISYTYDDFITFYLDGSNLLDQSYQINYGYPMPGISIFGGFSLKWHSRKKGA